LRVDPVLRADPHAARRGAVRPALPVRLPLRRPSLHGRASAPPLHVVTGSGEPRAAARRPRVSLVIPALNEEASLPLVLAAGPAACVDEVVVVDNGSTDATAQRATEAGARVVTEPRRGYGRACLTGIAATRSPDVVAFLDADFSDRPEELPLVL